VEFELGQGGSPQAGEVFGFVAEQGALPVFGASIAAPIWKSVMTAGMNGLPPRAAARPVRRLTTGTRQIDPGERPRVRFMSDRAGSWVFGAFRR
jgi:hypothetical protein